MKRRLIIAISGASGAMYGIRLLEILQDDPGVETHLIISDAARLTIRQETDWEVGDLIKLADAVYRPDDVGSRLASGSFVANGMVVAPCSIKTLAVISNSFANDLIGRAADVQLKEGRPLVLLVRETPLHLGHLRLMVKAAEIGAIIMPPVPNWYAKPTTTDEIINHTAGRVLMRLGIENTHYFQWPGID
ncbi:MAG: UbiX family flavin prenyltransferase [Anaerolineales bacterium]|nr:UbiX family flavin prenyltransferase [Anaerolineales bacterium]